VHTSPQFKKSITLVNGWRCEKGQKRAAQAGGAIFLNFSRTKTYIASYHLSSHDTNVGLPSDNLAEGRNDTMARKEALSSLRAILIRRRDALRSALNGDLTLLKELRSESPGDVIDAAVDTAQDEISSQLAEVEARELGSIENALERMNAGTYGSCEVCGGKIPLARLQALPYATMCILCQRETEQSDGHWMVEQRAEA
jgi:DnaK suppressor protein|tara:strand:+ start:473 stop:1069 length:597 start_codon:yes stop_codon:yes gene_type:complete